MGVERISWGELLLRNHGTCLIHHQMRLVLLRMSIRRWMIENQKYLYMKISKKFLQFVISCDDQDNNMDQAIYKKDHKELFMQRDELGIGRQILSQYETPLFHNIVFGESIVNDATSIIPFNIIHNFDLTYIYGSTSLQMFGNNVYFFLVSIVWVFGAVIISQISDRRICFFRLLV